MTDEKPQSHNEIPSTRSHTLQDEKENAHRDSSAIATQQPGLSDSQVADYLLQNPDFFVRHARQVEQMRVHHPVKGAISLVEWHMGRQRRQIDLLEQQIGQLIEQVRTNETLFSRILALQSYLFNAEGLNDFQQRLHGWARKLGLSGAYIRLFSDRWHLGAPSDFTHLALARQDLELLRIQRFGKANHYLGRLNGQELLLLLPQAEQVGSVAISLMGDFNDLGVLIFTSRDSQHYYAGMGTELLEQLAQLLPPMLQRWVERQ